MTYTMNNPKHTDGIPEDDGIRLGADPGALIAAIPALLGFVPEESLVLIALRAAPAAAGPDGPSQVGPVVRTDLDPVVVAEAATMLGARIIDYPEGQVIAVHIGAWDASPQGLDRLTEVMATAEQALDESSVEITGAYSVPVIESGAPWQLLHPGLLESVDWSSADGRLPDPTLSPAHGTTPDADRTGPVALPSQEKFRQLLDPVSPPAALSAALGGGWRSGPPTVAPGAAGLLLVAAMVASLPPAPQEDAAASEAVRDWLAVPGNAGVLMEVCDRADLFPVLVAAGVGPRGRRVRALLADLARLTRGALRHRALVLFSLASLAGGGGVVGHHAAHRALGEITEGDDRARRRTRGRTRDVGEDRQLELDRETVTARYAAAVVATLAVTDDGPDNPGGRDRRERSGDVVSDVLSEGLELTELGENDRTSLSAPERDVLEALVDRAAVSAVLRAIARRDLR